MAVTEYQRAWPECAVRDAWPVARGRALYHDEVRTRSHAEKTKNTNMVSAYFIIKAKNSIESRHLKIRGNESVVPLCFTLCIGRIQIGFFLFVFFFVVPDKRRWDFYQKQGKPECLLSFQPERMMQGSLNTVIDITFCSLSVGVNKPYTILPVMVDLLRAGWIEGRFMGVNKKQKKNYAKIYYLSEQVQILSFSIQSFTFYLFINKILLPV